jgi:putative flavoprotein involved in K+ transport
LNNLGKKQKVNSPVVIVGAGIAGLCISYYLTRKNVDHIILERGEVANTWINERWDNFSLVNPNWAIKIPEFGFGTKFFPSKNPDGFLDKLQTVDYLKSFSSFIGSKIYTNENVASITKENNIYKTVTSKRTIKSDIVIVASGAFGDLYIPEMNLNINNQVFQIHSSGYKNHEDLPEGGALVVGSGQSGAQIAEDLLESGKEVWLAVSKCGRRLRRYKGKDSSWWNYTMGLFDKTVDEVPFNDRWKCSPHTSGGRGGHDINLMDLAEKGLNLRGSVYSCSKNKIIFNNDLYSNLKFSDDFAINWSKKVDDFIQQKNMATPPDNATKDKRINRSNITSPSEMSFPSSVKSIIWATGFRYNFDWVKLKLTDKNGHPIQKRGTTKYKGFYFMGLQWMHTSKSAQFIGVGEDAEFIVNDIGSKYVF